MNEELKGILEKAYANGKTIDEVSAALKKNGYGDEDISFAGNFYNSKKKKPTGGESQSTQVQEPSFLESSIRQAQPEKAQGPSFLELPKYESAVSKATKPIISPQQMERDFEQARMQSMETGKPIDMFSSPTGQIVAEGIKQENAQVKREELSLSIADKLSAIKSSDDLVRLRPEIDEAYAKYKEFDLDGVAPTSLFNDDGSFNASTTAFLDSDLKSSIKRFSDEQKRLAENSNFLTRGLDAVSSGVLGFIDLSARLPYYLVGADAEPMLGGNVFATESKKLSEKTSLANYAEKFNMGYTPEQIEKGALGMALEGDLGLLGVEMADQVVNLVAAAAGGGSGLVAMGVVSAGSAFTEVVDDNNYKDGEKVLYAVGSGLVEYLSEKLFASDLKALRRTFGTAEDIAKIPRKDFGDMLFGKLPALARQPLEEGLEEAIVATTQEVMQLAFTGDKIDYKNIAESAFVGAAMGGSVGVVTSGPSALLQMRVFRDKIEIRNKIAEINALINDESISVEEKDLLRTRLTEYISKEKKMQADAEAYYSNFSEEDAAKTVKLNQTISDGMKNYGKVSSTEAKAQVVLDIKAAMAEKSTIEQKYDGMVKQQTVGGVAEVQVPQEVTQQVANEMGPKVRSIRITPETVGKSVSWMLDYVGQKADDFFEISSTTRQDVINGIQSIQNVVDSFSKSGRDVRVIAHTNAESFKSVSGEKQTARGMHIKEEGGKSEIHLFVPSILANTVYHEAIHEIAPDILGIAGTKKLAQTLRKAVVNDPTLLQYMGDFIKRYSSESAAIKDDEFVTELSALIASNQIEISVQRSIATKFLEAINGALGTKFNMSPTSAQLVDAMNKISNALGAGQAIDPQDMAFGSVVGKGVFKGKVGKSLQAYDEVNVAFTDNMPEGVEILQVKDRSNMDSALERSGGAFVIINSDATALRRTNEGENVFGGFGYSFIKQNIDDKIGFAASSDNKVIELGNLIKQAAEERDAANPEHKGKPVAAFIMIQSLESTFGNSYGAKFFSDGISKAINSGTISEQDFKTSFDEYIKKEVSNLNNRTENAKGKDNFEKTKSENDLRIQKIESIGAVVMDSDFKTKGGQDALQALVASDDKVDFKTRREFLEGFIPGVKTVSGPGALARNALKEVGFNNKEFFSRYLDKNIVDNYTENNLGGYALSGFFIENPYMGGQEYLSKGQAGKFAHPQFNSKFHGENPFLLDGKYYVNSIFEPQQFVSPTGKASTITQSVAGSMYVSSVRSKKSTRTASEQVSAVNEIRRRAKEANSLRKFLITAAPFVKTNIKTVNEAKDKFKTNKEYLELKKVQREIVAAFTPNLAQSIQQYDSVGGYRNSETGEITVETSSGILSYMSMNDAELIAALNGSLAEEIQNSALISRVDERAKGLLTEISLETKAQSTLLEKIDELGLNAGFSYTIEGGKNRITFAWNSQIESWGLSLDEYLANVAKLFNFVKEKNLTKDENLKTSSADVRFIEESHYGRIIQEARDNQRYKGKSWENLRKLLSRAEEKISNKAKQEIRFQKVEKSALNSFYAYNSILRSLQSEPKKNMRFLLESDISEIGDSDVASSRYLKFKAGDANREISRSFEIRFSDHTKIKGSEDAKMFVDDGHKIDRVNKIDYLNAWSPKTFSKAIDILRNFGFTITNESVKYGLKRFQAGGSEYEYLRSVSDYVNGRLVPNISEQEFVDKMKQLGVSDASARDVYNDFLDGGMGGKKKGKPNIDNIYQQYEDRVYQQPWYKELFNVKNLVNSLFDRQSNIKREILKANVEGAYDYLISKAGASARAKYSVNKADRKIFGGLNEESIKLLNKIISLRRIIEIDQSFDDRRIAATENLIKAKRDMDYAQYRVSSMASNLSVDKKNELKKKLDSATEEFNRIQKVVEESKRPLHTVDKKNNASLDKESSLEELERISRESDNFEELNKRADAYFDEFRSILDDLFNNGLITDELYNKIKDFDYSPRVFLNHAFDFGDNDISVRDYGLSGDQIKAIRDGSADDTIMDARYLLAAYAASASSRILKNRANKALYKAALDSDNSDWVKTQSKTGEADRGYETIYFFEKGESTKFQLRTDLKREWDGANRLLEFGPKTTKAISYITGSALLKLLATRANPLFIVRNLPRDYGHILFFTNIYDNQNIYLAGFNLFRDFIKGVKSFKSDDKYFQEYMEMGGGMDFLSTDGRPGSLKQNRKFFDKLVDRASSLGELSEIGFRIAVYRKLRDDATVEHNKKYGEEPTGEALELIKVNAVSRARAIIDFSQGGNLTKGLEIFKPYINSAFQGFRVGAEYIGRNPKKFASKFLQAQAGLLAISALNALVGGDDMDEIPDEVKLRYLIIMLPTKYTDEKGRERRAYIKIAKPQQMVPFFAMMDIMNGYVLGSILGKEYYPSDDLLGYATSSVASAMPTGASLSEITSSVPTISMAMTYLTNYDLFRKRAVTMDFNEVLPMDEGINDPNVERFYKVIGKVTGDIEELTTGNKGGVSPARLKASTEKVITSPSSSLVVGATYGILDILTSVVPLGNDMSAAESKDAVGKVVDALGKNGISISKSIWGETNPDWKVYNQKEALMKIDQESGSKRMKLSDSAKELGLEYISAKTEAEKNAVIEKAKEKVNEIKEDNAVDAMYYKDSFMTAAKKRSASQNTNEIIYSKDEEARAKKVYLLYGDMTDQELLEVRSQIYNESGYKLGPKFKYEYDKLTK